MELTNAPDYGLGDDWQYIDDVVDAGFQYSSDRNMADDASPPISEGVKVRLANPTQKQMLGSMESLGHRDTDVSITCWAETLLDEAGELIEPKENDRFVVASKLYMILSVKYTVFTKQYLSLCRLLPESQ